MAEIYRKRLIPEECIHLKNDRILLNNDTMLLTSWDTLRPKNDFTHGLSLYLFENGWKISKLYDINNHFVYWYCDIIKTDYTAENDTYIFTDLLADVIVEQGGRIRVVDLNEFEPAYKSGLMSPDEMLMALNQLNALLQTIYNGDFSKYTELIEKYE